MNKIKRLSPIKRIKVFITCISLLLPFLQMLLFAVFLISINGDKNETPQYQSGLALSSEVQGYADLVYEMTDKYGIREYARYLLAIMQVESGGKGTDVMQSLGNDSTKTPEKSIETACVYFAYLLACAKAAGVDMETVIQAYNYGVGYISYVASNGKEHTYSLACDFAAKQSGGTKVTYDNEIAVKMNGGWRYEYGNMFYVYLVRQYLAVDPLSTDVANAIISEAEKYKGYTYVWGGASPSTSFDCSGLVKWCYGTVGISLPHSAQAQYDMMQHITLEEAEPGDLVFFTGTMVSENYITHVGIYLGDNKMFHAGNPLGYADLTTKYWKNHFVCAGRIQ